MATSRELEYLATVNWVRRLGLDDLPRDAPSTELLVGRWRVRDGSSRSRAFLRFYCPALAANLGLVWLAEQLGAHVGDRYPTPVLAIMTGAAAELWCIRRREAVLARRWTARVGRDSAATAVDLLGARPTGALALSGLLQAAMIADVATRHGGPRATVMTAFVLLGWTAAVLGLSEAISRPMIAIDAASRTVDTSLRLKDVRGASCLGVVSGSMFLLAYGGLPTGMGLVLVLVSAAVWIVVGTRAGRAWLSAFGTRGGTVQ